MMKRLLLSLPLLCMLMVGCTTDPEFPERPIKVTTTGLPSLGTEADYEIWFSYPEDAANIKRPGIDHGDQSYFSVGKFRVNADGSLSAPGGGAATFRIPSGYNAQLLTDAILTVEPANANNTAPGARVLGGIFTGTQAQGKAKLEATSTDAFGSALKLDTTFRPFFLDTPTSPGTDDFAGGVWFGIDLNGTIVESLLLPTSPIAEENPDWIYETWLTRTSGSAIEYISLGQFASSASADANGAGPGAGPNASAAYQLPGEDFVTGVSRTLTDGTYGVLVSLQPSEIALSRPLLPLFGNAMIPAATQRRETIALSAQPLPIVEITVDR